MGYHNRLTLSLSVLLALAAGCSPRSDAPVTLAAASPPPAAAPVAPAAPAAPARTAAASTGPKLPAPCALCGPAEEALTRQFLDEHQSRYEAAMARAAKWLDGVNVDPAELRKAGIKGKKKLVEALDAYVRLYDIAPAAQKPALLQRIRDVAAPTTRPEYHDMASVDDEVFKQDATSYLRAAYLLGHVGLDVAAYKAKILEIQPRLDGQMGRRGSHQRMAFHWYYQQFGMKEPFPLDKGFEQGVIASRLDPYAYKTGLQVYGLTHEIFVPYQFGEKLDADFFNEDEKIYLRHTLERLTVAYVMRDDPDMVSELVSCLRYLRFTDTPVYREALAYMLGVQEPNGSWGHYERQRQRLGQFADQGYYLHTTAVAIDALSVAFYFRADRKPGGGPG